jgi:predicted TIM-barrel enzyme
VFIMTRFHDLFPKRKPIIAMAHVPPLPGTPLYDADRGVDGLVEAVRTDLRILLEGGVNAVMFCNEGDRPYSFAAGYDGVSTMTRVVTELRPTDRPFGVDFLWDPRGGPGHWCRDRRELHA